MEQTTIQRVAELYKKKSSLLSELSDLTNEEEYNFEIGRTRRGSFNQYGANRYSTVSSSFIAEIKKLTEAHIKQQIEEIDKELEAL